MGASSRTISSVPFLIVTDRTVSGCKVIQCTPKKVVSSYIPPKIANSQIDDALAKSVGELLRWKHSEENRQARLKGITT